jgi:hypothetical protein
MSRLAGFVVWCELVCDCCAKTAAGRHVNGYEIPRRDMKLEAESIGWKFVDGSTYCSRGCAVREGANIK